MAPALSCCGYGVLSPSSIAHLHTPRNLPCTELELTKLSHGAARPSFPNSLCRLRPAWASQLLGIAGVALLCDPVSAAPLVAPGQPQTVISSVQATADEVPSIESILARQLAQRFREMNDEELIEVLEQLLHASRASLVLSEAESVTKKSADNGLGNMHLEDHSDRRGKDMQDTLLQKGIMVNSNKGEVLTEGKLNVNGFNLDTRNQKSEASTSQISSTAEVEREESAVIGNGSDENEEVDMTGMLLEKWNQHLQDFQEAQLQGDKGELEKSLTASSHRSQNGGYISDFVLGLKKVVSSTSQQINDRLKQKALLLYAIAATGFVLMIPYGMMVIMPKFSRILDSEEVKSGLKTIQSWSELGIRGSSYQNKDMGANVDLSDPEFDKKPVPSTFGGSKNRLKIDKDALLLNFRSISTFFSAFLIFPWSLQGWNFIQHLNKETVTGKKNLLRQEAGSASVNEVDCTVSLNSEYGACLPSVDGISDDSAHNTDVGNIEIGLQPTNELHNGNSTHRIPISKSVDLPLPGADMKTSDVNAMDDLQQRQQNMNIFIDDCLKLSTRDGSHIPPSGLTRGKQDSYTPFSVREDLSNKAVPKHIHMQNEHKFGENPNIKIKVGKEDLGTEVDATVLSLKLEESGPQNQQMVTMGTAGSEVWKNRVVQVSENCRFPAGEKEQEPEEQHLNVKGAPEPPVYGALEGAVLDWFQHKGLFWVRDKDGIFVKQENIAHCSYPFLGPKDKDQDRNAQSHGKIRREKDETRKMRGPLYNSAEPKQKSRDKYSTIKFFDYRQVILQMKAEYEENEELSSPKSF